jgi:hypothetical protein
MVYLLPQCENKEETRECRKEDVLLNDLTAGSGGNTIVPLNANSSSSCFVEIRPHSCSISPISGPNRGGTPLGLLPGLFHPPALFSPMLRAGDQLNPILASAVVAFLQREMAFIAQANGRLNVARAQGRPLAFPPVTGDITEVTAAHWCPFKLRRPARAIGPHARQSRDPRGGEL